VSECFDVIGVLTARIVSLYGEIQRADPSPKPIGTYCPEGASRWVAESTVRGRSLPVNPATVQALRCAASSLEAHAQSSAAGV
jgi:hypothetical protein